MVDCVKKSKFGSTGACSTLHAESRAEVDAELFESVQKSFFCCRIVRKRAEKFFLLF
jgi:hypothetical protein